MAEYRAKLKNYIEVQHEALKAAKESQCAIQVTSEGNMAAYDGSLCELEIGEKALKVLRKLYDEAKKNNPALPPTVKEWNG